MSFRSVLIGGLGNQMFEYAFARALSIEHNTELYIKSSSIIYRPYLLNIFNILDNEGDDIIWNAYIEENGVYEDKKELFYYHNSYDNKNYNYDICGFWQNEKYFIKYENQIREDFKLEPIISDSNSITLQVRRGDYSNNPRFEYCDIQWYEKAIDYYGINNINIISDDLEWCKNKFSKYNINLITGDEEYHLRFLMGSKNIIISNSSFAWWGAWLSNTNNVIFPDVWIPSIPEQETGCEKWIKLKK